MPNGRKPLGYILCVRILLTQKTVMIVREARKMVFMATSFLTVRIPVVLPVGVVL